MQSKRKEIIEAAILVLESELEKLEKAYEEIQTSSKNAPSAMESHHDTSKEQLAKLAANVIISIEDKKRALTHIKTLKDIRSHTSVQTGSIVVIEKVGSTGSTTYMVVEHGGGTQFDFELEKVILISQETPIAQVILNKTENNLVDFILPTQKTQLKIIAIY